MKLFSFAKDGGSKSTVTGFWFIELKGLFSIVLLKFHPGSREAYHSHAFNALSWFVWGEVIEYFQDGSPSKLWKPSLIPKYTPRNNFHRVWANKATYCFTIRGPWHSTWKEYLINENKIITLTHGRKLYDSCN
jgi:hypothetical protein